MAPKTFEITELPLTLLLFTELSPAIPLQVRHPYHVTFLATQIRWNYRFYSRLLQRFQ
jgi:hypothetical protein